MDVYVQSTAYFRVTSVTTMFIYRVHVITVREKSTKNPVQLTSNVNGTKTGSCLSAVELLQKKPCGTKHLRNRHVWNCFKGNIVESNT